MIILYVFVVLIVCGVAIYYVATDQNEETKEDSEIESDNFFVERFLKRK